MERKRCVGLASDCFGEGESFWPAELIHPSPGAYFTTRILRLFEFRQHLFGNEVFSGLFLFQ